MSHYEITSDGKTVWVNGPAGDCVGRFSKHGIDVHHPAVIQMKLGQQCLECRHGKPNAAHWRDFQTAIWKHFLVIVGDQHMPLFLQQGAAT